MKNKNILIGTLILFVVTMIALFYFFSKEKAGTEGESREEVSIITQGSGENNDIIEVKRSRSTSDIHNITNHYTVTVPNSWSAETQPDSLKFYPKNDSGTIDNCLLVTTVFSNEGASIEEIIAKNTEGAEQDIKIINAGKVTAQNFEGVLQEEYERNKLVSEIVYIDRGEKTYAIATAYGAIHGREEEAEYSTCYPVFKDFVNSFTFTE